MRVNLGKGRKDRVAPIGAQALEWVVSKMIDDAQVRRTGSCRLLRHTCATHMLEGGADIRYIQQLLGHAKMATTAIYMQVSIAQLQEVHAAILQASEKRLPDPPGGG